MGLLIAQAFPEREKKEEDTGIQASVNKEDEQSTGLVIEYVTGNSLLKEKEVIQIPVPSPAVTVGAVQPEADIPAGGRVSEYTPLCYPKLSEIIGIRYYKEDLLNLEYLKEHFYIVNATTKMTETDFDVEYFLTKDLSIDASMTEQPQILIYHTHGSEGFIDSRVGRTEDTVVGVGELLADILREKYGYQVLHDTTLFDRKDGKDNRSYAYSDALPYIEQLLKENPSIEVVIDLHRDAGAKRVVTIGEKRAAKVMLFNGLCRNTKGEKLSYLPNENLDDNLAFSFQMKLIGDEMYPGLMNKIFLKDYRYNMHLMERYLLIELGTEQNTVEEAKNAMEPLADVLAQVLGE